MKKAPAKKPASARAKTGSPTQAPRATLAHVAPAKPAKSELGRLIGRIVAIFDDARGRVARSVNSAIVLAYWHIGREIVEHLQSGSVRAEYGDQLLEVLSAELQERVGRGYSVTNLRYFRLFYQTYTGREPRIRHEPRDELLAVTPGEGKPHPGKHHKARDVFAALERSVTPARALAGFSARLSWSHYRTLTKVEHPAERAFYEIEAELGDWSVPHLERQIHTQLFARLLKSRDKAGVLDLASRGQVIERPADAIKQPYVLDFLGLPESARLRESDIETAILEKLQQFLLELGKGFAFVARQKRITFDDEEFYVDLVFYNIVLKCFLLIELKLGKLTHQDVGQLDSYVRLFDEQCRTPGDGPTIGLILCAEKNEAIARYSVLRGNEQLFAAKYLTYLPSVEELQRELQRERRLLARPATRKGKR